MRVHVKLAPRHDKRHRKMSSHTVPIREGIVVLEERHSLDDLKKVTKVLEKEFGMEVFQNDPIQTGKTIKQRNRNWGGHLLAKWVEGQGKTLRLREHHIRKMQTVVAQELGMPRGKRGSQAARMEALEHSEKKARERLAKVS